MTRLRLPFIHRFYDRHGKVRHYFRRPGFKRVPLPGLPGSDEFMEAYRTALAGAPEPVGIGSSRTTPGTVNAAIVAFYKSHTFTKNKPITRQTDRNILEAFRVHHGDKRIALMERRHVMAMIAEKAGKPAAQRNLLRVLRVLLAFAVERGCARDNPALGIKLKAEADEPATTLDRGGAAPIRAAPPDRDQGTARPGAAAVHARNGAATWCGSGRRTCAKAGCISHSRRPERT